MLVVSKMTWSWSSFFAGFIVATAIVPYLIHKGEQNKWMLEYFKKKEAHSKVRK